MGPSGVTAVYPANGFAAMFGTAGFYAGMHYLGYLDFFQFVKDQFAHHGEVSNRSARTHCTRAHVLCARSMQRHERS